MYDIRLTYDYDQKYSEFVVSELVAGSRAQVMGHSTTKYSNVPNKPACRLIWHILFFKREEVILPFSFEITKCAK